MKCNLKLGQFYEFAMQKIDTYKFDCDCSYNIYVPLGGIQQLRGQEEGEGGSAKSPRLSTQGEGGVPWMSTWTKT